MRVPGRNRVWNVFLKLAREEGLIVQSEYEEDIKAAYFKDYVDAFIRTGISPEDYTINYLLELLDTPMRVSDCEITGWSSVK